jgi:repressor LexA
VTPPQALPTLTSRQQQVLDALRAYWQDHGYAPRLEDLGALVGLTSKGSVHPHIEALRAEGLVEGRGRSLRPAERSRA